MPGVNTILRAAGGGTTMGLGAHALGLGINVGVEKMSGGGWGESVAKGAFWFGVETFVRGGSLIPLVVDASKAGYEAYHDHKEFGQGRLQKNYRGGFGGNFNDTQQGYTMRQRSVQALQQSKMNARNVLGSEARTFHRPMY